MLSSFIPADERIVTIEDAAELQLHQDHVLRLESRPANIEGKGAVTSATWSRTRLRMRPDRIVVGEVRDASALDMLQAMNTGHDGSICTVHSNGPRDTLARIETMVLMAGMDLPIRAIREQVASAVDLIVHQTRLKDGSRRITHVTEVERMEGDVITLQDIFVYDHSARLRRERPQPAGSGRPACAPSSWRSWPTPTSRSTRCSSPWTGSDAMHGLTPGGAAAAARSLAGIAVLLARRPRRTADDGDHRPRRDGRRRAVAGRCARFPAGADVDLDASRSASTATPVGRDGRARRHDGRAVRAHHVLAIDISNSMAGERFEAAKAAATDVPRHGAGRRLRRHRHVRRRRRDRRSTPTRTATRPSRSSTASTLAEQTGLYDGVLEAVDAGRRRGPAQRAGALRRRGHHQDAELADVTAAIRDAEVTVDVVALDQAGPTLEAARRRWPRPATAR